MNSENDDRKMIYVNYILGKHLLHPQVWTIVLCILNGTTSIFMIVPFIFCILKVREIVKP
mgnify:CR=1 FL=1